MKKEETLLSVVVRAAVEERGRRRADTWQKRSGGCGVRVRPWSVGGDETTGEVKVWAVNQEEFSEQDIKENN